MNRAALQAANSNRYEYGRKLRIGFFLFMALLMQLAFVISYTGAMHGPQRPHRMPVGVVAPAPVVEELQKTSDQAGPLFTLMPEPGAAEAEHAVQHRDVLGAYVPATAGTVDELLVTTALGPAAPQAMQLAFTQAAQAQQHTLRLRDVVPPHRGTPRDWCRSTWSSPGPWAATWPRRWSG
ncbi:hypothetical protein ACFQ9X_05595 [Catenulispora yoronensis]